MKKFFIFLFIIVNISPTNVKSEIFFLDIDYILNNSSSGKIIINKLNKINSQNIKELKLDEEELQTLENEINKIKNIASKQELDKKIIVLKEKFKKYQDVKAKKVKEFETIKNDELNIYFKKITPLIENFMETKSIKIILDKKNVFIANKNYDITKELTEFLDTNLNND
tara:strand:+ start:660 stop:1166 length:507 start_codon:yes stop_codon:yes gene_type:complete